MAVERVSGEAYEIGPIRPPSEAYSLLLRLTRNCPWNRCRFCPVYKGSRFELRSVEDIKRDIDAARSIYDEITSMAESRDVDVRRLAANIAGNAPNDAWRNVALFTYTGGTNVFLQDANSLIMKTPDLLDVLRHLKSKFPDINRITMYARSHTAARKSVDELKALREAGISRLHIGLESGYDPVLALVDKGATAADHIAGGKNVVASGISLSEYVMLGLGGRDMWREHALETARVLNEINPDYIRFRTLTIQPRMELAKDVAEGRFVRATDEEIVAEEKLFLENLDVTSTIASDHIINLLPDVEGKLPDDREKMLGVIERFQALMPDERDLYKLGRRLGIMNHVEDMRDPSLCAEAERLMARIEQAGDDLDEVLYRLMERYI